MVPVRDILVTPVFRIGHLGVFIFLVAGAGTVFLEMGVARFYSNDNKAQPRGLLLDLSFHYNSQNSSYHLDIDFFIHICQRSLRFRKNGAFKKNDIFLYSLVPNRAQNFLVRGG